MEIVEVVKENYDVYDGFVIIYGIDIMVYIFVVLLYML